MRVLTITLTLLLSLSGVLASAAAPQASAAACMPSCPLSDKNGSDLAASSANNQAGTITCFYPALNGAPEEFSCSYSSTTGQLTADHDEDFCPSAASTGCGASRRKRHFSTSGENRVQNVVRKHSAAVRSAVHASGDASGTGNSSGHGTHDVPDYVKSRALLSRRFRAKN